jgi:MFS family permease
MTQDISRSTGPWRALFAADQGIYLLIILLGTVLYSVQVLVVATIMPTVVADIGGALYYVWASMLYVVGSIVGAASLGPVWAAIGGRRAFVAAAGIFAVATVGCAVAGDMLTLNAARAFQGYGGGLITGGLMGVVSQLFRADQRTRVLALYQGAWTLCSLVGPLVGGAFAEIGWWRGTFWTLLPFIAAFCALAWWKIPDSLHPPSAAGSRPGLPLARLTALALGVVAVAHAGALESLHARAALLVIAVALVGAAFRLDARAHNRLFPSHPLSISRPVGLGFWVLIIGGAVQAAVIIYLPLTLQVVHGVSPLWVGATHLVLSSSWTLATFMASGWNGARERFALRSGPVLMFAGVLMLVVGKSVTLILLACFVIGFGIGIHNIHLSVRVLEHSLKGEEAITASSSSMVRSLGMALGTAAAGLIANVAGLGAELDVDSVAGAVRAVFIASLPPLLLASFAIVRLAELVIPRERRA